MPEGTLERIWAEARRMKEQGLPGTPTGPLPTGPTLQFPDQPKPHEKSFMERLVPEDENRLFTAVAAPFRVMSWLGDQESKYITEPVYGFWVKTLAKELDAVPEPVRDAMAKAARLDSFLPNPATMVAGRVLPSALSALTDEELRREIAGSSAREAYQKAADRSDTFYWTTQLLSPVNVASLASAAMTGGTSVLPTVGKLLGRGALTGAKAARTAGQAAEAAQVASQAQRAGRAARMARGMTTIGKLETGFDMAKTGAKVADEAIQAQKVTTETAAQVSRRWSQVQKVARIARIPFDIYDETYAVLLRPYIWVTKDLVGKPLWWGVKTAGRPLLRPIRSLFEASPLAKRIQETRIFGSILRRNLRQAGRPLADDAEAYMQAEIEAIRTGELSMEEAGDPQLLRYYQRTGDEQARSALLRRGLATPDGKLTPEGQARLKLDDALIRNGRFGGAERTFAQQLLNLVYQLASAANPERSSGELWKAINVENVADGSLLRGEISRRTVKKGKKSYLVYDIKLGKDADITTLAHEFAHLIDFLAPETFRNVLLRHFGEVTSRGMRVWTDRSAELFALAFEQWLFTGRSSIPALDNLMKIFRDQAEASYFRAQPGVDMPDEVARAIEELLTQWRRGQGPGPDEVVGGRPKGPEPGPEAGPAAEAVTNEAEMAAKAESETIPKAAEPAGMIDQTEATELDIEKLARRIYARKLGQALADLASRVQSETARRLLLPNLSRRLWAEAWQEAEAIVRQARQAAEEAAPQPAVQPKRSRRGRKTAQTMAEAVQAEPASPVQEPVVQPEPVQTLSEPVQTMPEPAPAGPEIVQQADLLQQPAVKKRTRRAKAAEQTAATMPEPVPTQPEPEPVPAQPEPVPEPVRPEPEPAPQPVQNLVEVTFPGRLRREVSEQARDLYYQLLRSLDEKLAQLADRPSPVPGVAGQFYNLLALAREFGGTQAARRLARHIQEQLAQRYGDSAPRTVDRIGQVLAAADQIQPTKVRQAIKTFFQDYPYRISVRDALKALSDEERRLLSGWLDGTLWREEDIADRLLAVADRKLDELRPAIEAEEASALTRPAEQAVPLGQWPNPTDNVAPVLQKLEKATGKRKPKNILERDLPVVTILPDGTFRTTTRAFGEFYQEFVNALARRISEELQESPGFTQTFVAKLYRQHVLSPEAMRDLFAEAVLREAKTPEGAVLDPGRLQNILSLIDRYRQATRNSLKVFGDLRKDRALLEKFKALSGEERKLAERLLGLDLSGEETDFLIQRILDRARTIQKPSLFGQSVQEMAEQRAFWQGLPAYHRNYVDLLLQEGEPVSQHLLSRAGTRPAAQAAQAVTEPAVRAADQEMAAPAAAAEPEPVTPARPEEPADLTTAPAEGTDVLAELDQWATPKLPDGSAPSAEFADSFETTVRLFANDFLDAMVEEIIPRFKSLVPRKGRARAKEPAALPVDKAVRQAIVTVQKLGLTDPADLDRVIRGAALQFLIYGYRDLAFQLVKELEPFLAGESKPGSVFGLLRNVVKKTRQLAAKRAGVKSFEEIAPADLPEWAQEVSQFEGTSAAERAMLRGLIEGDPTAWPWENVHKLLSDSVFEMLARFLPDMDLPETAGVMLPAQRVDMITQEDVARVRGLSVEGLQKWLEESRQKRQAAKVEPAEPVQATEPVVTPEPPAAPAEPAPDRPAKAETKAAKKEAGQAQPAGQMAQPAGQAPAQPAAAAEPAQPAARPTQAAATTEPAVTPETYRLTTDIGQGIEVRADGVVTVGKHSLKLQNMPGYLTARHVRELVRLARKLGADDPLEFIRNRAAEVVEGVDEIEDLANLTDADLDQVFRYLYNLMSPDRTEAQLLAKAAKRVNELRDRLLGRTTMTLGRLSRESRRILTDALRAHYLFDSEPLRFDAERAKQVIQEVMRSGRLRPTDHQFLSKFNDKAKRTNWEQLVTELEDIANKVERGEPLRLTTYKWVQSWQPDELEDRLAFALSSFPRLPVGNEPPVERDLIDLMYQALRTKAPGRINAAIEKARKRILDLPESMVLETAKRIGRLSLQEYLDRVLPDILSEDEKAKILAALQSRLSQVSANWNSDKIAEYLGPVMSEIIPKEGMVLSELGREVAIRMLRDKGLTIPQDAIRAAIEKLLRQGIIRYENGKLFFVGLSGKKTSAIQEVSERVAQSAAREIWQQASSLVQTRGNVLAELTEEEKDQIGSALAYILKQQYRNRGWPSSTLSGRILLRQVTERLQSVGAPVRQRLLENLSLSDLEEIGQELGLLEAGTGNFRIVWGLIDEVIPDEEIVNPIIEALGREPDAFELDLGRVFGSLVFQAGGRKRVESLGEKKIDEILQRIVDEYGHIRRGQPLGPIDLRNKLIELKVIVPLRNGQYRIDWPKLDGILDIWKVRNKEKLAQPGQARALSTEELIRLLSAAGSEPVEETKKAARKGRKKAGKARQADQTLQQDISLRRGEAFVAPERDRPLDLGRFRLRESASLQEVLDAIAVRHGGIRPEQVDRVAERIQRVVGNQAWFPFTSLLIDETAEQAILRAMRDEKVADRAIAEALSRMGMRASQFGVAHPAFHKVLRNLLPNQFGLPRTARGSAVLASGRSLSEREAEILARARQSEALQRLAQAYERDRELIGQRYETLRQLLKTDTIPAWDPDKLTVGDIWKLLDSVPSDAPVDIRNVADELRKLLTDWNLLPKKKRPAFSRAYSNFLQYKIDELPFRTDLDEAFVRKASAVYFDELGKIYKIKPTYLERLVEIAVPESVRKLVSGLSKAWRQLAVLSVANVMRNVQDIYVRAHLYGFGNQLRSSESVFHRAQAWELGGLPGVMIEPFQRIRSSTEEFEAPIDLLAAKFLRKFGKLGEVPADLLQWMADNRWEIIAISESAARGAAWKTFAEQHFAENVLPALMRRLREAGIDPEVIRRIEAEGLDLGPSKFRQILLEAGVNRNRAEELVTALRAGIAEADRVGTQKAYQIFFDYENTTRLEQELGLHFWLPFHYWATRNVPFYLDTLSSHPRLLAFLVRYESASRRFREIRGLPGKFAFMLPFSIGGRYFGVNPFAIFSIFDQFRSYPELDSEDGALQQLYDFLSIIGVSPSPFVMIPLERAGLVEGKFDVRLVPRFTQWVQTGTALAGLNQGRGYDPEAPILRLLTGEDPDAYRQRLVRRRLREMSIERTGRPDSPEYQWAMLDPSSPLYQEALRDVNAYLARRQLVNFLVGLPTAEAGPTEVQVSRRRSQYPEELTPEQMAYLARTGDIGTAYWGIRAPEQVQVNLGFFLDRNMMPGWQHYYADEIEQRIPGYRSYLEWLANRGPGQSRSLETWLKETGRW